MKIILVANGKRLSDFEGIDIKGCYKLAYSEYRWLSRPGREFLDNSVYQDVEQVALYFVRDNEFLPQLIMSTKVMI